MARQNATAEFKTFVKGIITEVSPLTFPDNASIDEENFVLNRDGSRERRFGLDFENNYVKHSVQEQLTESNYSAYRWIDGKGVGAGDLIVVQMGSTLKFFDGSEESFSNSEVSSFDLSVTNGGSSQSVERASYARTGAYLVVASGGQEITRFTFENGVVQREGYRLTIRDFFGVEDYDTDGTDLTIGTGLLRRPTVKRDRHIYNLRNQSWGQKFTSYYTGNYDDPIYSWRRIYSEYPANGDVTTRGLYADTTDSTNRTLERFWEENLHDTDYGSGTPPRGAFIIDFVERGASRLSQIKALQTEKGLGYSVTSLPAEYEYSSAKSVAAYSGRVFYAGFPGGYSENSKSPTTESMVLFSQNINTGGEFGLCYQEGDPTSKESPDLVATDGGYLQVEDAYNIHTLAVIGAGLIVIAANGVWQVTGGSGYSFAADNFLVKRISDKGAISAGSVVNADDTLLYWGEEGIFQIAPNNYGDLTVTSISKSTIQTLYDEIPYEHKESVGGLYDPYESKIRWVYGERFSTEGYTTEIVLDTVLGSFSKNTYKVHENHSVILPIAVPPYTITEDQEIVTSSLGSVTDDSGDTYITHDLRDTGLRGVRYLVGEYISDTEASLTLAYLSDSTFVDWMSVDGVGVDASAMLLTGYFTAGDIVRKKQLGKFLMYFRRTETGFEENSTTGDWDVVNPSSCWVTSMWEWTDNANAGRWSNPIQTYRLKRQFFPENLSDSFDNGEPVVVSQNKLRGRGRVLSLKIESEAGYDLQILGWATAVGIDGTV